MVIHGEVQLGHDRVRGPPDGRRNRCGDTFDFCREKYYFCFTFIDVYYVIWLQNKL